MRYNYLTALSPLILIMTLKQILLPPDSIDEKSKAFKDSTLKFGEDSFTHIFLTSELENIITNS